MVDLMSKFGLRSALGESEIYCLLHLLQDRPGYKELIREGLSKVGAKKNIDSGHFHDLAYYMASNSDSCKELYYKLFEYRNSKI